MNVKSVPADEAPSVTVPAALSVTFALKFAFAVTVAAFVKNAVPTPLPSMLPFVDVRFNAFVNTVPVIPLLCRSLNDVRLVVPTGVPALPMFAPTSNVPACATNVTVAFGFAFAPSIAPFVCNVEAFVAVNVKSVPADDAPKVTVPAALSVTFALKFAFAVTVAAFVWNAVPTPLPSIFPFNDVRFNAFVNTVPVMPLLCRSLNDVRLVVPTGVPALPMFAPTNNDPA